MAHDVHSDALPFPGGSELAARCRALDWSATPLGPPAGWSPALRAAVRLCLESPAPINLWCGTELVLIYNDAYRRVLGGKHPSALGRPGPHVWAEIWEGIAPMFADIAAGGAAYYREDQPFTVARAGGDGHELEPAWFTYSLSPVRDEDGTIAAYLNIAFETTGRMQAQQAADAAHAAAERAGARLREVFAQAPVGVCVLSGPEHVYEMVNPLYQRFFPGRALLGLPVAQALPELAGQGVYEMLDRVLEMGEPVIATEYAVMVDRTGAGRPEEAVFSFVYQPMTGSDGAVDRIAVVATDVTELAQARRAADVARQQAEEARRAAEEANAAKSQFLAMMSHELRTPLNAIGGWAELLEMGIHGDLNAAQQQALARIRASQQHLLGLINAVLNFARLEAGRVEYHVDDVPAPAAIEEVLALMAVQARGRRLTLEAVPCPADASGDAVLVRADPEKLRQVLLNLLSNALKFTDPGGRVTIACAATGNEVRFAVRDTGHGIAPEQLQRIFEPFVQVGREFSSRHEGTGLGLAISRDLARGMGGELTAESRVGEGSTFTLTLRRAALGSRPSALG